MPLLGNIIKGALTLTSEVGFDFKNDLEKQESVLKSLLEEASNTSFGKYYDFRSILHKDDIRKSFGQSVPIHNYNTLYERWWSQQLINPDITWPGHPSFYARSSGTTGSASKRIPVTEAFISSMRKVSFDVLKTIPAHDLPDHVFESEVLMISSAAELDQHQNGHLEGEISGINIYNLPDWYDVIYRPGKEIATIKNWDERLKKIVEMAPGWNIGAIAGIPSWVLQVLKAIVKTYDVPSILAIWPNLKVFMSGGVAFETYRKSFEQLCGKDLHVIDTYLASEGFFSYSDLPGQMDMKLALDHGYYYEFIPFDSNGFDDLGNVLDEPQVIDLREVELDKEYALVVSTCAGAWRYMIGDTIKFTSLEPYRILLTGRTKFFLNVTGSQLSEEKLDNAIGHLAEALSVEINEYTVGVLQEENDNYFHQWILVSNHDIDPAEARKIIDNRLQSLNHNYEVARGKALKDVRVKIISPEVYLNWIGGVKKLGGQVKVPKVMSSEKLNSYLEFIGK